MSLKIVFALAIVSCSRLVLRVCCRLFRDPCVGRSLLTSLVEVGSLDHVSGPLAVSFDGSRVYELPVVWKDVFWLYRALFEFGSEVGV